MDLDDAELETQLRETLHRAALPVHGEGVDKEAIHDEVARRQASRTRARWTGRLFLAAAVAAAAAVTAFVLVRPGEDDVKTDEGPVATQPPAPPTTEAGPATTETPSTTPSTTATPEPGTGTGSGSGTGDEGSAGSTTTAPTTPALPEFPPEFTGIAHGQPAWGLYLAVAPPGQYDAPELAAAGDAAAAAGYGNYGGGDINCDQGAAEALGVEPNSVAMAVYFANQAQADQAKAAFEARGTSVVGVARVLTGCMD